MSRAFVKEDGRDEQPLIVARAPLPEGAVNYVTQRGLSLLQMERRELEEELEGEPAPAVMAAVRTRLAELSYRLAISQVIDPDAQPRNQVRFGARVGVDTVRGGQQGEQRLFTLVGVDEADSTTGRIGFYTPLARALLGKRVGDEAVLVTEDGEETLKVVSISYAR